ncbi:hypothetical protein GQ53DRAFT_379864 [Thozetella sp. PMI_491]|nr:hypothetical protein GQ53DRAFT_379864 [Thozetella sp. PMI_491]
MMPRRVEPSSISLHLGAVQVEYGTLGKAGRLGKREFALRPCNSEGATEWCSGSDQGRCGVSAVPSTPWPPRPCIVSYLPRPLEGFGRHRRPPCVSSPNLGRDWVLGGEERRHAGRLPLLSISRGFTAPAFLSGSCLPSCPLGIVADSEPHSPMVESGSSRTLGLF